MKEPYYIISGEMRRMAYNYGDWTVSTWPFQVENKPKSKLMKLTNLVKKLVDSDTQALIKAGYLNGDLELTSEGRKELETILFLANKPALVEAAKEAIADKEKEAA